MAYDFHSYLADLVIAAHEKRNEQSHGSAEMLDQQLHFAIQDAARVGAVNPATLHEDVGRKVLERAGPRLYDLLMESQDPSASNS